MNYCQRIRTSSNEVGHPFWYGFLFFLILTRFCPLYLTILIKQVDILEWGVPRWVTPEKKIFFQKKVKFLRLTTNFSANCKPQFTRNGDQLLRFYHLGWTHRWCSIPTFSFGLGFWGVEKVDFWGLLWGIENPHIFNLFRLMIITFISQIAFPSGEITNSCWIHKKNIIGIHMGCKSEVY